MSAFLTSDDLVTLTGLRQAAAQIRWLRRRRVRHMVNAAGRPVVARGWLTGETAEVIPLPAAPDLRALPGRA